MRDVYDYKDIRQLENTSISQSIERGIVITATAELASALASYYPQYRVFDVHYLIKSLIPEWEEDVKDIKNYVVLRNNIEEYVSDNDVSSSSATYLRRNAADMWNAIKLLIEADVYPDDIDIKESEPIMRFRDIWKLMEQTNDQIMTFRLVFAYELSQQEAVFNKIKASLGEFQEDFFFIGFYFITPIQERIFDVLEAAGVRLHFLNCHDAQYKYATQIWEKTFSQYEEGTVRDIQENLSLSNCFGDALVGKETDLEINLTKHFNELEFAEMVKSAIDKGEVVYSPDAKQCEKILREYYPEYYEQKHLLSYPVGQYIYYLHMMWNSFSNEMDMKFEYVYKCFASGWLIEEGINGKEYLYELKVLESFFKNCKTYLDWESRITVLLDAKEVTQGFNTRSNGDKRWHQLMGNPLLNVGAYAVEERKLEFIAKLIKKIIKDARFLFESERKVDLYEHFSKIIELINNHYDEDETLSNEKVIVDELLDRLQDDSTKGVVCPMNGIRDAIIMLIGSHFGEYESYELETSGKKRMVLPISMVEAAMLNNYGEKTHLVLANEFSLPGQPRELPWPLTEKMLDSLHITQRSTTMRYVKNMRAVIENRPLSYRYLFYSFMGISNTNNTPKLSLEWICKNENKDIDVSAYVKLLDVEGIKLNASDGIKASLAKAIKETRSECAQNRPRIVDGNLPEEVTMDYLLCKERYVYSYLLNKLPTFSSEFHYSFVLSKLISALSIVSGVDKEIVSENVGELFPYLRNIELRQSTDFAKSQGIPEPIIYENNEYPAQRLLVHYLSDDLIQEARKRYDKYLELGLDDGTVREENCTYCPYANICMKRHQKGVAEYE